MFINSVPLLEVVARYFYLQIKNETVIACRKQEVVGTQLNASSARQGGNVRKRAITSRSLGLYCAFLRSV